ncbi:hypothetical protein CK516_37035 [Nostoc sp. 'Peltigera malacea cyanobiont' DB3992]|nr:hypothetical protein CK516_37035 [Nostoc sp. 'Peltigera malacea cyanobiont' DB3992]
MTQKLAFLLVTSTMPLEPIKRGTSLRLKAQITTKDFTEVNKKTDIEQIMPMLPASLKEGGHLERQLRQGDLATASPSSDSPNKVTMDRVREAAVGVKFAKDHQLSLDKLRQSAKNIDFESENPNGEKVQFDPFMSPQVRNPRTDKFA